MVIKHFIIQLGDRGGTVV